MTDNRIFDAIARKESVGGVQPPRHVALRKAAESLSRKTVDMATCELLNEAHSRLILLCYEQDNGQLVNVDVTGRILIPLPWGKKGYLKWGLASSEADTLRRIMFARMSRGLWIPLFHFDNSRRSWYLQVSEYPTVPPIGEWEITVNEFRSVR